MISTDNQASLGQKGRDGEIETSESASLVILRWSRAGLLRSPARNNLLFVDERVKLAPVQRL